MTEYVVRFLAGGVVASVFAMLGDVLRPQSFAGRTDEKKAPRFREAAAFDRAIKPRSKSLR